MCIHVAYRRYFPMFNATNARKINAFALTTLIYHISSPSTHQHLTPGVILDHFPTIHVVTSKDTKSSRSCCMNEHVRH